MHIDRSNYEIWVIDWLDGKLDSLQSAELMLFLDKNQDLREEINDLTPVNLSGSGISFPGKENLRKLPSEISHSQFEYLCAAYLENDLTVSQQEEVLEIADTFPEWKKSFDQIQKATLTPPKINYKHKRRLLKLTTTAKVIRFSLIGLSTAAAISLLITLHQVISPDNSSGIDKNVHNLVSDKLVNRLPSVIAKDRIIQDTNKVPAGNKIEKRIASNGEGGNANSNADENIALTNARPVRSIENQETIVNKVYVSASVDLNEGNVRSTIIPSGPLIRIPDNEVERSKTARFISKTFRQKILKEKAPADSPIKGYEIAEAGVAGLNKLLGWQMALDTQNDGNGQVKSVRFSSGILKIQAPVKIKESKP